MGRTARPSAFTCGSVFLRLCISALVCVLCGSGAFAQDFLRQVDVSPMETVEVQDQLTLKTFDSYARQQLSAISGKTSVDGAPAIAVILDMAFRPEAWHDRNIVKIKNAPLRKDVSEFPGLDDAEKDRIRKEGTVSLSFLARADVDAYLRKLAADAVFKANAIQDLAGAADAMGAVLQSGGFVPSFPIPPAAAGDDKWKSASMIRVNVPRFLEQLRAQGAAMAKPLPGYEGREALIEKVLDAQVQLSDAWRDQKVDASNRAMAVVADLLAQVVPEAYPSIAKRKVEVIYNRLFKMTIPAAFMYTASFTLFLMGVYSGAAGLKLWGRRLFTVAFLVHTVAIGVRWWLVSRSVGNWFEGIPIKNQFESVMFSSWFGALVALVLEYRTRKGIWGAAASFVGWLAMVALFSTPYVFNKSIGEDIHMVNGVLMSYWLYIHVTMVTAAYALISMSFVLGAWWLIKYTAAGGASASIGETAVAPAPRGPSLELLDQCNLVILQLAFWVLGVGIVLGAVWADQSWGRPWGWDPKETFALVTWIIYLAVVHIRLATAEKAWWTSVLSIFGFVVMLFNWIGVNFFLVGLHSYA